MKRRAKTPYRPVEAQTQEELESLKGTLFATVVFVGVPIILTILLLIYIFVLRY